MSSNGPRKNLSSIGPKKNLSSNGGKLLSNGQNINYEPALAVLQMTKPRVLPGLVEQELDLVMLGGRKVTN